MAKRTEAGYKTIRLGPAERLDAIRANLAAFSVEHKREDLEEALAILEEVGTRIRAEAGESEPAPKIYTWIEGYPGPPTLHNWDRSNHL